VGRLVPENCVHHIVDAFKQVKTDLKCVIVGGSAYAEPYIQSLHECAADNPRIIFTGYVFGEGYLELGSNAYIFIGSSMVGGTHPALVEAMAFGNTVVVNDTPENLETIGDAGFAYIGSEGAENLAVVLQRLLDDPEVVAEYSERASERAQREFTWDAVTDRYEALCYQLTGKPLPQSLQSMRSFLSETE